jgi:hypothetical protein
MTRRSFAAHGGVSAFHVHRGHRFEGFEIVDRSGLTMLVSRCDCGRVLDIADAAFEPCPACTGAVGCFRCGGTGIVVDHAALSWRLPSEKEGADGEGG